MKNILFLFIFFANTVLGQDTLWFNRGDTIKSITPQNWTGDRFNFFKDASHNLYIGAKGNGANPVFSSWQRLSNPVKVRSYVYRYKLPAGCGKITQVRIDGEKKTPTKTGWLRIDSTLHWGIKSNSMPSGSFTGGEVVIRYNHWTLGTSPVKTDVGNVITYQNTLEDNTEPGWGFFLQNHNNLIKRTGDYFINDTSLTVYFSTDPSLHKVEIATNAFNGYIVSCNNLTIENIDFDGANEANLKIQNVNYLRLINCKFSNSNEAIKAINNVHHTQIINCITQDHHRGGINLAYDAFGSVIRGTKIFRTGLIPGAYRTGTLSPAVMAVGDSVLIEGNYIENTGGHGIYFLGEDVRVRNNIINGFALTIDDVGGIYTFNHLNKIFKNWIVENNLVMNGKGNGNGTPDASYLPAYGLYSDDKTNGGIWRGNTVFNCNGSGTYGHNTWNVQFIGNNLSMNHAGSYWYNDNPDVQMINNYQNNFFSQNGTDIKIESTTGRTNFFK